MAREDQRKNDPPIRCRCRGGEKRALSPNKTLEKSAHLLTVAPEKLTCSLKVALY
jgi:hypothetical protein